MCLKSTNCKFDSVAESFGINIPYSAKFSKI